MCGRSRHPPLRLSPLDAHRSPHPRRSEAPLSCPSCRPSGSTGSTPPCLRSRSTRDGCTWRSTCSKSWRSSTGRSTTRSAASSSATSGSSRASPRPRRRRRRWGAELALPLGPSARSKLVFVLRLHLLYSFGRHERGVTIYSALYIYDLNTRPHFGSIATFTDGTCYRPQFHNPHLHHAVSCGRCGRDHPQITRPGMLQGCSHATRRRFPSRAAQRSPTAGWVPLCRCTAARAVRWRPG